MDGIAVPRRYSARERYTVVLDPQLAGAVIHETLIHLSEADNTSRSASVRQHFRIGNRLGANNFSVVDVPHPSRTSGLLRL